MKNSNIACKWDDYVWNNEVDICALKTEHSIELPIIRTKNMIDMV